MNRDRSYYRMQRNRKIAQRNKLAHDIMGNCIVCGKPLIECMMKDKKTGLLHKGNSGYLSDGRHVKTNSRKGHSTYRHKGAYGKDMYWSHSDQQKIDSMESQISEYAAS